MKKIFVLALSIMVIMTMSGCSDFGFNPTGHWQFVSDDLYANDVQIDSARAEDDKLLADMVMVFEKSGTGYINAGGIKTDYFQYSYHNETVTVTYLANEYHNEDVTVEFKLSEDRTMLVRTDISTQNGITYREENIYQRV